MQIDRFPLTINEYQTQQILYQLSICPDTSSFSPGKPHFEIVTRDVIQPASLPFAHFYFPQMRSKGFVFSPCLKVYLIAYKSEASHACFDS